MITKRNKALLYMLFPLLILLLLEGCHNTDISTENNVETTNLYEEIPATTQKVGKNFITNTLDDNALFVFNKGTGEFKIDCIGNLFSAYAHGYSDGSVSYRCAKGEEELNGNDVKSIYFKEGIEVIGDNPIRYFKNVTEVTIPKSTKRILRRTFPKNIKIETINYGGTPEEWEKVLIDNGGNEGIQNCKSINYNVKVEKSTVSNYFVQRYGTESYRDEKINVTLDYYTGVVTVKGKGETDDTYPLDAESISTCLMETPSDWTEGVAFPTTNSIKFEQGITRITNGFCWYTSAYKVYLPKSLKTIDKEAFCYNDYLTDVYYAGSERQWKKIKIAKEGNESLLNAKIHYKVRYKE